MLKEFLDKLASLVRTPTPFDPSVIGDPLALKTSWSPAKPGGANFRTHKLVEIDMNRIEFRSSFGGKLFCMVFIVGGTAIPGFLITALLSQPGGPSKLMALLPLGVGILLVSAGGAMLYSLTAPIVFDRAAGSFQHGRRKKEDVIGTTLLEGTVPLSSVHALQIVSEFCRGNKSSYYSYELNLVLDDGSRVNVVDHGNLARLREDAQQLSAFLGKPVWDATERKESGPAEGPYAG